MKRYFLVFLIATVSFALWRLPSYFSQDSLRASIKQQLLTAGVLFDAESLVISPSLTLSAEKASIITKVGKLPIPVFCDKLLVHPLLSSLAGLNLAASLKGGCYQGKVTADISHSIISGDRTFNLGLNSLELNRYPLLAATNTEGLLSGSFNGTLAQGPSELLSGSGELSIKDGAHRGGYKILGLFSTPPVSELEFHTQIVVTDNNLVIKELSVVSSLGSLHANGNVSSILTDLQGTAVLTDEGITALGGYFALASGLADPTKSAREREWDLKLTKNPKQQLKFATRPLR